MLACLPFQLDSLAQRNILYEAQMMLMLSNPIQVLIFSLSYMTPFPAEDQKLA
jgi:hypothetical protein